MKNKDTKNNLKKIKEMWSDKKERAKIQLCLYGIFFVGVFIFAKILGAYNKNIEDNKPANTSFLAEIKDNYEYDIEINIDDNIYRYYGRVLGNNATIIRDALDIVDNYYIMNNKYYILDTNGNYVLTTKEEVYSYIDYRYLDIKNIREFMNVAIKEDNIYKIKISDLILNNNNSQEFITLIIDENNKLIEVDYTNLFKIYDENISKETVKIRYRNINNIISLEE